MLVLRRLNLINYGGVKNGKQQQASGGSLIVFTIIFIILFVLFPVFTVWLLWAAIFIILVVGIISIVLPSGE